jgi:hypothetical protein
VTPEQNVRLALVDNVPRDQLVAAIARHLFRASRGGGFMDKSSTPRDWYRAGYLGKSNQ